MRTRLKELRARDGLNQTELAKRAKVSRQTISLIEREEFIPSLLIAVRIAKIFNEPIENIFIFTEEEVE
ncbi:putative transcriptional regulator [Planococcus glaciei]|uniref:helix-turn-helix transcriptional regulator n=1 Tax=Planococcus glaciei TaxID=459472 RepID=UPI000883004F|nr:helix-turn-helix transcriptional regulator [Planococcus glaciei]SDG83856.1 putative transcriptional regulator [Planococcus glaciei]